MPRCVVAVKAGALVLFVSFFAFVISYPLWDAFSPLVGSCQGALTKRGAMSDPRHRAGSRATGFRSVILKCFRFSAGLMSALLALGPGYDYRLVIVTLESCLTRNIRISSYATRDIRAASSHDNDDNK